MSRRWAFAALAMVAMTGCEREAATEDEPVAGPVPVACVPAQASAGSGAVTLRGVVGAPPERDAVVAPLVAGRIEQMRVREGDRVAAGDLLAVVDVPDLTAAVRELDAARASSRAALANAETGYARAVRLFDEGIGPRRAIEDAQARRTAASAELDAAQARRDLAVEQRARARVTAPIAGVVVRVTRRAGELVDGTQATPIVEIADPSSLELRADAPAADLVHLAVDAPVAIHLDALPGRGLPGRIVFVSPAVDPTTSLGVVRAAIDGPGPPGVRLVLGLSGRMTVARAGGGSVVTVPAVAVRRSTAGAQEVVVCAATGDRVEASIRSVTVGIARDGVVEITGGLAAGEPVVTDRVLGLEDGTPLAPRVDAP